ncbi:MAG: aminomethyl-transferring glycine dehydrogenase subunit GcvPA [Candidatus Cloacimonetes bacterium]|nr:aminomethyl-transferring glycine dehydrogenase subunit GcvPA [Candidatus Cloacimonadota bacterium]
MSYIANTDKDRQEMLDIIGVKHFNDLIANIPEKLLLKDFLKLDKPLSEIEIKKRVFSLLSKNKCLNKQNSFLGGGVYDHFVPVAVDHIVNRPEFVTAYTPYQAEVSQGTLQWIYEYQSLICELTGMEISNAGMYDGASAAAEAILMASRKNRLTKALVSETLNPVYIEVIKAYTEGVGIEILTIPMKAGVTDLEKLRDLSDDKTSCVVIQTPNFYGIIEDCFQIDECITNISENKKQKPLFITINDPISLAILNAPNEYNADIVVGEGQALGNRPYYGGPLFGFMASKMDLSRNMPGRIVGATTDIEGNRAYSLTLQAREQHIRRDKATSNICSNQALCNLAATVYMCLMGKNGLREVAELSTKNAHYLAKEITNIKGFTLAFEKPFFKEFAIKTPTEPKIIIEELHKKEFCAGIEISVKSNDKAESDKLLLIAVTEKKTKADMDNFVNALKNVITTPNSQNKDSKETLNVKKEIN